MVKRGTIMSFFKSEKFQSTLKSVRSFLLSTEWMIMLCCLAAVFTTIGEYNVYVYGTLTFAFIIAVTFIISDDFMATLLPFLLTVMISIHCYDSYDIFIGYLPLAIPLGICLIGHFVLYWKPIKIQGSQFWPMVIASTAITLGGLGFITPGEYFSPTSLYHVVGLGFGMVFLYLLFYAYIDTDRDYSLINMLTKIMVIAGAFGSFMIISFYIVNINKVLDIRGLLFLQWRNNLSTLLMIFMPFPFLLASRKSYATVFGFIYFFGILLTGSRGGLVFGAIELMMCIVMYILYDRRRRIAYLFICGCVLLGVLIFFKEFVSFFGYTINRLFSAINDFLLGESQEVRAIHCARGINDYLTHPIFGTGLGYMGNRDVHASKEFSLCWYHCEPIQIAASLGTIGILAYIYQFIRRNMLIWRKVTLFNITIFISYAGLELMSLVNPGVFAPFPYLMLITMFFVIVEKCDTGEYQERISFRRRRAMRKAEKLADSKKVKIG